MMGPPFKCPECGIWWAGLEHRCGPTATTTDGIRIWPTPDSFGTGGTTVHCTCPPMRVDGTVGYVGTCLVHDVQVTYGVVPS